MMKNFKIIVSLYFLLMKRVIRNIKDFNNSYLVKIIITINYDYRLI